MLGWRRAVAQHVKTAMGSYHGPGSLGVDLFHGFCYSRRPATRPRRGLSGSARTTCLAGSSALVAAGCAEKLDATLWWLNAGANVTAPARNGDLPLHRAVRRGNDTVTRRLLEVGADASARGAKGRTWLHIAAWHGHLHLLEELGAALSVLDAMETAGWTAAHHAAARGHDRVLEGMTESWRTC